MIKELTPENEYIWAQMCTKLYKESSFEIFLAERKKGLLANEYLYFLDNEIVAFISLSLRSDYVEGTTTSPVAYLDRKSVV